MINQRGITLIELLISVIILLLIGLEAYILTITAKRVFFSGRANVELQESARDALDLMAQEIRHAGFRNWSVDPISIQRLNLAHNNTIGLEADLNTDGAVDDPGERVTYRFISSSNVIERRDAAIGGWEVLARDITDLTLTYLDANNRTIPNESLITLGERDRVRVVRIDLRGLRRVENTTQDIRLKSDIKLRNTFYDSIAAP